jgi:hypothetical protein
VAWLPPELEIGLEPELKPPELELELEPDDVEPDELEPDEPEPDELEPDEFEFDDPELDVPDEPVPDEPVPDEVELDPVEDEPDDAEEDVLEWCADPGRARATTPAAATLARVTVVVADRTLARPSSLAAMARRMPSRCALLICPSCGHVLEIACTNLLR